MVADINKNIGIVVCIHGNEQYGLKIKELLNHKFHFIIGNPKAVQNNVRYIDKDLNRVFPGKNNSEYYEENIASKLAKEVDKFDKIIDIHSTSEYMPTTGFISEPFNKKKFAFLFSLDLKNIVLIPDGIDDGITLDKYHKCCVCIEAGPHKSKQIELEVENILNNINKNTFKGNIYKVFKIIAKPKCSSSLVENYKLVKKGEPIIKLLNGEIIHAEFDFYPILANEVSYTNTLCLAANMIYLQNVFPAKLIRLKH